MSSRATPSLDDLRAQARRTFRYWPIYLMLRLREVEQHLTSSQIAELGPVLGFAQKEAFANLPTSTERDSRIALLVEYGLLTGNEPLPNPLPTLSEAPASTDHRFEIEANTGWVSLFCVAHHPTGSHRLELLRANAIDEDNITIVAATLNQMSVDLSSDVALDAARLWASLHGARQLAWQTITFDDDRSPFNSKAPALPPRRRGRGMFRAPH